MTRLRRVCVAVLAPCLLIACGGTKSGGPGDAGRDVGPLPPDPCITAGTCPPGVWINVTPPGMAGVIRPTANEYGPGQHRRRSGATQRHLCRRQRRRALEVDRLRQHLDADQRHAPGRPARRRHRGRRNHAGHDLGRRLQHHLQVDRRRARRSPRPSSTSASIRSNVDPNDTTHLISGLHEADGIVESTDGGRHLEGGRRRRLSGGRRLLVPVLHRHRRRGHDAPDLVRDRTERRQRRS